jgi:hypothetical protein
VPVAVTLENLMILKKVQYWKAIGVPMRNAPVSYSVILKKKASFARNACFLGARKRLKS